MFNDIIIIIIISLVSIINIITISIIIIKAFPPFHPYFMICCFSLQGLFNENSCQSLEDVYLLQVRGANTVEEHSNEKRFDSKEASLHKTFSTKLGTLILYAESFYKNEKKKSKIVKKKRKSKAEEIKFEGTVEELANSILRFGNVCYLVSI